MERIAHKHDLAHNLATGEVTCYGCDYVSSVASVDAAMVVRGAWRADPILAAYAINGYLIVRGDDAPIARTTCGDESEDEQAAELIVAALNALEAGKE